MPLAATAAPPPSAVAMPVLAVLSAVAVVNSCDPLTASVLAAETTPAATLVIWRSALNAPTETTAVGAVAAAVPPLSVNAPVLGAATVVALPIATEPVRLAAIVMLLPIANALFALIVLLLPSE